MTMIGQLPLMSSAKAGGKDEWCTPPIVLDRVRKLGPIALDPCTDESNPVGARVHYTPADDGLRQDWAAALERVGDLVYCNPPYSQMDLWAVKIAAEATLGTAIVALVGARTDTRWWRALWNAADVVGLWRGRLRFVGADSSAPFPSAVFGFNVSQRRFKAVLSDVADIVTP